MQIREVSIQLKVLKSLMCHQSMKSTRVITKVFELNFSASVVALGFGQLSCEVFERVFVLSSCYVCSYYNVINALKVFFCIYLCIYIDINSQ